MKMTRKIMVCSTCKGKNIQRDAFAKWNTKKQCWELSMLFFQVYCDDCGDDTKLEEKNLTKK